jgi:hypothetical protein
LEPIIPPPFKPKFVRVYELNADRRYAIWNGTQVLQENIYDARKQPPVLPYSQCKCTSCTINCATHDLNNKAGYICKRGDCHNLSCGKDKFLKMLHNKKKHYINKCHVFINGTAGELTYGIQYHISQSRQHIPKNSIIGEYCGEVIDEKEVDKREQKKENDYIIALNDYYDRSNKKAKWFIDAKHQGNWTRFVNHSCAPNCEYRAYMIDGRLCAFIVSLRTIRQTEELTCYYDKPDNLWFKCLCSVCARSQNQ